MLPPGEPRSADNAQPALLGALADAVVTALRELPNVRLAKLPRMADFAKWGVAASIGGEGVFINAYTQNRVKANDEATRANQIAECVISWFGSDTSTKTDLQSLLTQLTTLHKERLAETQGKEVSRVKPAADWPSTPKKLANELRRCAPNLRRSGIEVRDGGLNPETRRAIKIFSRMDVLPTNSDLHPSEPSKPSRLIEFPQNQSLASEGLPEGSAEGFDVEPSANYGQDAPRRFEGETFVPTFRPTFGEKFQQNQQVSEAPKAPKVPKDRIPAQSEPAAKRLRVRI